MASFTTAPPSGHTKQYVFVDEYNRHKRLKVMRACDGCRKRKIRCDGALQNGPWPCGACVRLKLKCIPPTLDPDDEPVAYSTDGISNVPSALPLAQSSAVSMSQQHPPHPKHQGSHQELSHFSQSGPSLSENLSAQIPASYPFIYNSTAALLEPHDVSAHPPMALDLKSSSNPLSNAVHSSLPLSQHALAANNAAATTYGPNAMSQGQAPPARLDSAYANDHDYYSSLQYQQYVRPQDRQHHPSTQTHSATADSPGTGTGSVSSPGTSELESVRELSDQMGELQIDITSEAHYIANQKKSVAATPAVEEESDIVLPPSVFTDPTVRVPPEMMPDDKRAMSYFVYYFKHIHPYVPVLSRSQFLEQWHTARDTISPLLLESIFACVARYLEQPIEARRWLALASRHEESYKDEPRLSTIQAMAILMKARESLSRRGYYFRSWMAVKYMVTMANDLALHTHGALHRASPGRCTLPIAECMIRTRVWQSLFTLEILVGAPQGRSDFDISLDDLPVDLPSPDPSIDSFELESSLKCTALAQAVGNIKISNQLWQSMRRLKTDWALDPQFVQHNADMPRWLETLPSELQLRYDDEGNPPWLGRNADHFVANLHAYHHLVVIMHHRPQLQALLEKGDAKFRYHLDVCLASAEKMCRIQEALHRDFNFHGLQFMQRGINFTIYCVLTCTMLHLAAITSPDPSLNSQARIFFPRHMRVLEHCLHSCSPEMTSQINALREAFSADTSQPFRLKPTLGLRSPVIENHPTPLSSTSAPHSAPSHSTPGWSTVQDARLLTPNSDFDFDHVAVKTLAAQQNPSGLSFDPHTYDSLPPHTTYANPGMHHVTSAPAHTTSTIGYALEPVSSNEQPAWDPSGIFNQWNTAFGGGGAPPPSTTAAPHQTSSDPRTLQPHSSSSAALFSAPTSSSPTPASQAHATPTSLESHAGFAHQRLAYPTITATPSASPSASQPPHSNASTSPSASAPAGLQPVVTPVMWQDAFTTAFVSGHGLKRYREASVDHTAYAEMAAAHSHAAHSGGYSGSSNATQGQGQRQIASVGAAKRRG